MGWACRHAAGQAFYRVHVSERSERTDEYSCPGRGAAERSEVDT